MADHKEAVQDAKGERWYREEVHGGNGPRDGSAETSANAWPNLDFSELVEAIATPWFPIR
jgi:hypothetical protein